MVDWGSDSKTWMVGSDLFSNLEFSDVADLMLREKTIRSWRLLED